MDHRYQGPYLITKHLGKGLYRLQAAHNPSEVIKKINGAHLKPYKDPVEEHVSMLMKCVLRFET